MTSLRWVPPGLLLLTLLSACGEDQVGPSDYTLTLSPSGPLTLNALGDSVMLRAVVADGAGMLVETSVIRFSSTDSTVVQVSSAGMVHSVGVGNALIVAREASGAADSLAIAVSQDVDSIEVFFTDTSGILSYPRSAPIPLACLARDRNGFPVPGSPSASSATGTVAGLNCSTITALRSGFDTLTISAGGKVAVLPFALAVHPVTSSPVGEFVSLDSFPFDYRLWAPSARTSSQGVIEIYVTGYEYVPDSNGVGPGALHRLRSDDGVAFQYDGIALNRLSPPCELICSGIENIAVIPREDAPGWRMLFAAGSSGSYGWQVFSAVSDDELTWMIEPGIRISNGGTVPPAPPMTPPWPVGEGMVIDQLASGEWRMIVGGYEPVTGTNKFQIVEYRSMDQLSWTYAGVRFATSQMPSTAQRSVYSPSLVEFVPGLWRMFVAADDLNVPGGRSRVFTAVSRDRTTWEFEMELLGSPGTSLYYTALVNDRLYFLRQDAGQLRRLAAVTVAMP